jgi:hypothetical protein
MTVWCADLDETHSHPNLHTRPVKNHVLHCKNWGLPIIAMIVRLRRALQLWQHWLDGEKRAVSTLCSSLTNFHLYIIFTSETFLLLMILQYNLNEAYLNKNKNQKRQFLPYGRSIGSWTCLTRKTYTCHTVQNITDTHNIVTLLRCTSMGIWGSMIY